MTVVTVVTVELQFLGQHYCVRAIGQVRETCYQELSWEGQDNVLTPWERWVVEMRKKRGRAGKGG